MFELHENKGMYCIKMKSVAPSLNLGTHSLRAGQITTVANKGMDG